MKNFTHLVAFSIFFVAFITPFSCFSQTGEYEVRFNLFSYDEPTGYAYVDIEIKATSQATEFKIADQNYRFGFNRNVVPEVIPSIEAPNTNPPSASVFIDQELELSSIVFKDGTTSFFNVHTLSGTSDTLTSVNIDMAGGDGTPIYYDTWVKVNRLRFEIANDQDSLCLKWNQVGDFPPTVISELFGGSLYPVSNGIFQDICFYLPDIINFLPMELTAFSGKEDACHVKLDWETATETDSDYFIVERSSDGRQFAPIGSVKAAGTSGSASRYTFTDPYANEQNYYRLVQVDFDNSKSFSELIVVKTNCFKEGNVQGAANVYPNPASPGIVNFRVYHAERLMSDGFVSITDAYGRLIWEEQVSIQPGINKFESNLTGIPSGNYFYRLVDQQGNVVSKRFVLLK